MANRRIDSRRIKIHFAYSVEEAAAALQTHKNTIRGWIKQGLPIADHRRPIILSVSVSWSPLFAFDGD